jgi:hypothetical protein
MACSRSLTWCAPMPMKPPSLAASAAVTSHRLNAAASSAAALTATISRTLAQLVDHLVADRALLGGLEVLEGFSLRSTMACTSRATSASSSSRLAGLVAARTVAIG